MQSLLRNLSEFSSSLNSLQSFLAGYGAKWEEEEDGAGASLNRNSDPVEIELKIVLQSVSLLLSPLRSLLGKAQGLGRRRMKVKGKKATQLSKGRPRRVVAMRSGRKEAKEEQELEEVKMEPVAIEQEEEDFEDLIGLEVEPQIQEGGGAEDGEAAIEMDQDPLLSPVVVLERVSSVNRQSQRPQRSVRKKRSLEEDLDPDFEQSDDVDNDFEPEGDFDLDGVWTPRNGTGASAANVTVTTNTNDGDGADSTLIELEDGEEVSIEWPLFRFREGFYFCPFEPCQYKNGRKDVVRRHMMIDNHAEQFEREFGIKPPSNRKYKCEECGKAFPSPSKLKMHMMVHTEERPFQCEKCAASFKRKKDLEDHEEVHLTGKKYSCEECLKEFKTMASLKFHKRTTHGKGKDAGEAELCPQCGVTLKSKRSLARHMIVVHTNRHFKCDQCPKIFKEKCKLTNHVKKVHNAVLRADS